MPALPEFLRSTELLTTSTEKPVVLPPSAAIPITPRPAILTEADLEIFDNPVIGGKLVVFVLLHGDRGEDIDRHRRCIRSIVDSGIPAQVELRVLCCRTGPSTRQLLIEQQITPAFSANQTLGKYEVMRRVFRDPVNPIDSKWTIWIDDVAYVQDSRWLHSLAAMIVSQGEIGNTRVIGNKFSHWLTGNRRIDPRSWFKRAAWFRNKNFRTRTGQEAPNGDCVHYFSPNFFAIRTDAITICDIPDSRLIQYGGGVVIGEQLHQHGYTVKAFNGDIRFVAVDNHDSEHNPTYPWTI